MQPLLTIENLSVDFISGGQTIHAVQDISFSVKKRQLIALVGESGSGKSVTALSILRLLPVPPAQFISGKIIFNHDSAVDLLKCPHEQLQNIRGNKIAMIFQEPMTSLNPVISCGQQVSEAIIIHKKIKKEQAKQETVELFRRVELPDPEAMFHRYPHQLSGGQKQRVMIAMAMSCSPDLLICDEPTTALDVTVQKNILLLIKKIQQTNNMAVIFISHDLGVVAEIADDIAVMYKGKIVERDTAKKIFTQPEHPYTKALLSCRPALHTKNERLPVVSDFMEVNDRGNIIEKSQETNDNIQANEKQLSFSGDSVPSILSVKNLKVYFTAKKNFFGKILQQTNAVDDVSFDIYEGETLGLVGGSGCGKTTLGRTLLRLIEPTEGKIYFKGRDISTLTDKDLRNLRKDMQIIFQDPYSSLNPREKIGDAIAEPLLIHHLYNNKKERKEKVIELLEKVNLSADFYNRYPHEFSGGQRQRIVIARALALRPSFIICDESISALDVSVQAQVLNLLNDLKKEFAFTAVFISHDLSVVRYISNRIIVMNKGKIEEEGEAEKIYTHPEKEYTQQLLTSIPQFHF